jgi:hypothetical protein
MNSQEVWDSWNQTDPPRLLTNLGLCDDAGLPQLAGQMFRGEAEQAEARMLGVATEKER